MKLTVYTLQNITQIDVIADDEIEITQAYEDGEGELVLTLTKDDVGAWGLQQITDGWLGPTDLSQVSLFCGTLRYQTDLFGIPDLVSISCFEDRIEVNQRAPFKHLILAARNTHGVQLRQGEIGSIGVVTLRGLLNLMQCVQVERPSTPASCRELGA